MLVRRGRKNECRTRGEHPPQLPRVGIQRVNGSIDTAHHERCCRSGMQMSFVVRVIIVILTISLAVRIGLWWTSSSCAAAGSIAALRGLFLQRRGRRRRGRKERRGERALLLFQVLVQELARDHGGVRQGSRRLHRRPYPRRRRVHFLLLWGVVVRHMVVAFAPVIVIEDEQPSILLLLLGPTFLSVVVFPTSIIQSFFFFMMLAVVYRICKLSSGNGHEDKPRTARKITREGVYRQPRLALLLLTTSF
mmetsp:Transcript_43045/g.90425  ORF Transcript_43045/g.90425 Transcript_43045/m.90425 type:complete len:249 (+) Transcript_43045:4018-4764(+)